MRDAIGIGAIFLIGLALYVISIPGYEPHKYDARCPDSRPIIIDGEFSGQCTNFRYNYVPMWVPPTGPAPLVRCVYCDRLD